MQPSPHSGCRAASSCWSVWPAPWLSPSSGWRQVCCWPSSCPSHSSGRGSPSPIRHRASTLTLTCWWWSWSSPSPQWSSSGSGRPSGRRGSIADTAIRVARPSRIVAALSAAGGPPSLLIGVRHVLERGRARNSIPVGSALLGSVLAVTALCATGVFGSSLNHLTTTPSLYGQPFDAWFSPANLSGPEQATKMLADIESQRAVIAVTAGISGDITATAPPSMPWPASRSVGHSCSRPSTVDSQRLLTRSRWEPRPCARSGPVSARWCTW